MAFKLEYDKVMKPYVLKECKDYEPRDYEFNDEERIEDIEVIKRNILPNDDVDYEFARNTLLIGETGTGKTHVAKRVAYELEMPYVRVNLNGGSTVEDIIGTWIPSKGGWQWKDGVVVKFAKHGGIVVVDEINAAPPEINFIFHSLLDDDRSILLTQRGLSKPIKAHPSFAFIATMNPPDYEGVKPLNKALFNRFHVVLDYGSQSPIIDSMPKDVKRVYNDLIDKENQNVLRGKLSPRDLLNYIDNKEVFGDYIARHVLLQRFEGVYREAVEMVFDSAGI